MTDKAQSLPSTDVFQCFWNLKAELLPRPEIAIGAQAELAHAKMLSIQKTWHDWK